MSMASEVRTPLADRILAYMNLRPPPDRLYRRSELDVLGPRRAVDQALVALTEAQRVGSPGPDIWFPLAPAGADEATRLPPAPLKEMAESLLRREGVTLVTSPQERDHYRYHATGGKEGVWGVPTFEDIGVESAAPLFLHWVRGKVHTIHNKDRTMPADTLGNPRTGLTDPAEFRHLAYRMGTVPPRLEKDFWVNHALRVLGGTPPPGRGLLLFTGGTCLTKAWRLSSRFSEDIDLRFQGDEGSPVPPDPVKQEVHAHVWAAVQQLLLPLLPGGRLDRKESAYRPSQPLQRLVVQYDSHYTRDPGRLQIDIAFTPGRVPWTRLELVQIPKYTQMRSAPVITQLPCVAPWAIMAGKLHAVSVMPPGADAADMRHIADLGRWLQPPAHDQDYPFMVQQSQAESSLLDLVEGLWANLDTLASDPHCADLYGQYVGSMFPSLAADEVPDYQTALHQIRTLWQGMCDSDWENPQRVMDIPPNAAYTDREPPPPQSPPDFTLGSG